MSAIRLAALALALAPITSAWAADVTPEQGQSLQQQVRAWVVDLLGPTVKLRDPLVQLTPAGDHYDVAVPLGAAADAPKVTALARPLDNGRWSIDDVRIPSPAHFTVDLPVNGTEGNKASVTMEPVTYDMTVGQQSGQILLDPSLATPTTLTSSIQALDLHASGTTMDMTSHVDHSTTSSIVRPVGGDRVDVLSDGTAEGYRITAGKTAAGPMKLAMDRVRVTGTMSGLSRERGAQLVHAIAQIGSMMDAASKAGTPNAPPPKLDDQSARDLLAALADLATGVSLQETIDRLSLSVGDTSGTLNQARIGLDARVPQGFLQARMELAMEGLTLPDLPIGEMATLIPTRVALQPSVAGIAVADLMKLADDSRDGKEPPPEDVQALFGHGGITAGLDSFAVDVAGTSFSGMGKLVLTSPQAFTATAQITATNLDLLQQRVAAMPELAQALPVFIFAKGIGRSVQNQMVWDVTYRDGKLLVNNQDLSAMMGGDQPAQPVQPKPPAGTRPQPQRPATRSR